jgi:ABC-type transport system involved in multi-copper enzyme maturation permease subunit
MKILALAHNTFREAVRDKVFVLVGAFGLVLVLSTVVLSPLTVGAQEKIVADIGLSSITIFSLLVILFMGSGMLHKEIDKRTIMTILSKPITRLDYLVGKYLGLLATLLIMIAAMVALFSVACGLTTAQFKSAYWIAFGLASCEMMVMTAVLVFFSSFSTPVLTSLFTLGVFLAGHTVQDLQRFAMVTESKSLEAILNVVKYILPNLDLFNVRNAAVHGLPIESAHVIWALLYGLLYSGLMLILAEFAFRRREFK